MFIIVTSLGGPVPSFLGSYVASLCFKAFASHSISCVHLLVCRYVRGWLRQAPFHPHPRSLVGRRRVTFSYA